jgi:hypothetical protein
MSSIQTVVPWESFYRRWAVLEPPLRPHPCVRATVRALIASHNARVLLLGSTPEYADLGAHVVAVDHSDSALGCIWPGTTDRRFAVQGQWARLPCATHSMSAAIGDGSLNCLEYPSGYARLFGELARRDDSCAQVASRDGDLR